MQYLSRLLATGDVVCPLLWLGSRYGWCGGAVGMSVDCVLCVGIGGVGAGTLPLASGYKFFPNAYPQMFTTLVLLLTQSAVGAPTSAYVDSLDDSRHDVEEELTRRTTTAPQRVRCMLLTLAAANAPPFASCHYRFYMLPPETPVVCSAGAQVPVGPGAGVQRIHPSLRGQVHCPRK